MAYTYYRLLAFIPKGAALSFDQVYERLQRKFSRIKGAVVERPEANHIQLKFDEWLFHVHLEDEPHVAIESEEIAGMFKNKRPDWEVIASSDKRISTHAMPDPNMDHFNDYVFVMEVLEAIPELYIFDPNDGKLWKAGETPPEN